MRNPDAIRANQDQIAEREKHAAVRAERNAVDRKPVMDGLSEIGLAGQDLVQVVAEYSPLPEAAVDILLFWLPKVKEDRVAEGIARALCATKVTFDGRPLESRFKQTWDESLKWAIVNTVACRRPHSIDDWIKELLKNDYWRKTLIDLGFPKRTVKKLEFG